jgi:hypothetical protein
MSARELMSLAISRAASASPTTRPSCHVSRSLFPYEHLFKREFAQGMTRGGLLAPSIHFILIRFP